MSYVFVSNFADRIQDFVQQKNALGYLYEGSMYALRNFDKMCSERFSQENQLTQEICLTWAVRKESEGNNALRNRLMPIREFARFLNRCGEKAFVLPPNFVRKGPRFTPHIYSEAEIASIWQIADSIKPNGHSPIRHLTIPTFIRLLYCCGLRPCEARKLRVEDVDLASGRLEIAESKGHKDRFVWMADDVRDWCRCYNDKVERIMPGRASFFPNPQGRCYSATGIQDAFRQIRVKAGIVQFGDYPPRLYDFRHTFATHRLYQWMREGKDISAALPYLSAYMGHVQLSDTYYYIHLVPGLLESMSGFDFAAFADLLPEVEAYE